MLKAELLELITNGESSVIEFKRDDIRPEQLAVEVVALANFQGGRILLGVDDDGSISGITRDNNEEWVMNVFRDKVHPTILPFYEQIRVADKTVAMISFPQGISKPYVLRDKGREDIYIRMGSTSRLASREQQMRLYEVGGILHTETLPVPRTDMNCLDFARLENYLNHIIQDPDVPTSAAAWQRRLLALGFLTEVSGKVYCSIAGLLLFGKAPHRYLKQAGMRVMVFDGTDKSYDAIVDESLDGAMVGRFENGQLLDAGLIDKCLDLIKPFISSYAAEIDERWRRTTTWLYPIEAIRETLLNALAHRDWTQLNDIELVIYRDRFELLSPGGLPNSMTLEKMKAGQRSPRNSIIMEILRDYGYVEARGMGVRTKIVPLTKALSGRDPEFVLTEDYLKTVLYKLRE